MGDGFMHDSKLPLYLMATLSTVLVLYNFIAVCFRSRPPPDSGGEGEGEGGGGGGPSSSAEESSAAANARAAGHVNVAIISDLIPAHKYSKSLSGNIVGDEDGGGGAACAVCLGEFEEGDELRTLPECLHSFHAACIDLWLFKHPNCPICRAVQLTH